MEVKNRCFEYGNKEIIYLTEKDEKLGAAISAIGRIEREILPDRIIQQSLP